MDREAQLDVLKRIVNSIKSCPLDINVTQTLNLKHYSKSLLRDQNEPDKPLIYELENAREDETTQWKLILKK